MKKTIFAILALVCSALPTLHFFGVKDFVKIAGFLTVPSVSKLTARSFIDRSFQTSLEASYSKQYFLRGVLYKTRCQVFEWVNLGVFHESPIRSIGQFADGTLFQYAYLRAYCDHESSVSRDKIQQSLSAIKKLDENLATRGIDMMFVLAADKVQMTDKPLPWMTRALVQKHHTEFQSEFMPLFAEYGIKPFNTYSFLKKRASRFAESMYPYAGTHWNALGSALVTEAVLKKLNRKSPEKKKYRINRFIGVEETPIAKFADDDIGRLLNLFDNPYLRNNIRYLPKFKNDMFKPNKGSVFIYGDSFGWEIYYNLMRSGEFAQKNMLICDKKLPSESDLERVMPDLKLVIFVFVTPNMLELDKRFGTQIETICQMLQQP